MRSPSSLEPGDAFGWGAAGASLGRPDVMGRGRRCCLRARAAGKADGRGREWRPARKSPLFAGADSCLRTKGQKPQEVKVRVQPGVRAFQAMVPRNHLRGDTQLVTRNAGASPPLPPLSMSSKVMLEQWPGSWGSGTWRSSWALAGPAGAGHSLLTQFLHLCDREDGILSCQGGIDWLTRATSGVSQGIMGGRLGA